MLHTLIIPTLLIISVCAYGVTELQVSERGVTPIAQYDPQIHALLSPVVFDDAGLERFFAEKFNTTTYARSILPSSCAHLIDFLAYGAHMRDPFTYYHIVFDLFTVRFKDTPWVNPFSVQAALEAMPGYLAPLCIDERPELHERIRKTLYDAILNRYQDLKTDPDIFMQATTQEILDHIDAVGNRGVQELRTLVMRFLEGIINKVIWSPEDGIDTWRNCTDMGKSLSQLRQAHIIGSDRELNQLCWSLIARYAYFIELCAEEVPVELFTLIKKEVLEASHTWFLLAESDPLAITKRDYLLHQVTEAEVTARLSQESVTGSAIKSGE